MTLVGIIFWIGIAVLSFRTVSLCGELQKNRQFSYGLGFACIAYTVVMALRPQGLTNAQRAAVRNKLTAFLEESANMQRLCEDNKASVPDVAKWKIGVEKYLETLDH